MASNAGKKSGGESERGFGAMGPQQQREIAGEGGRAAHESGNANEFTPQEAREAGRKGGAAVSQDREHMAEIGRKGGEARAKRTVRAGATDHPKKARRAPHDGPARE